MPKKQDSIPLYKFLNLTKDTFYTDINFLKDRLYKDDCPLGLIVSASTRNKLAKIIELVIKNVIKKIHNCDLVKRFLKLVKLHKFQLIRLTEQNLMKRDTLTHNLFALKSVTKTLLELIHC